MLDNFSSILILLKYPLIGLFSLFSILSFYWPTIFKFFNLKPYNNVQRVHKNEVSRLSGLIIYFFFWIIYLFGFVQDNFFFSLLFSALPFVLISIKEDLFHNTTPKNRLFLMIISCLIFFYINPITFPIIDIPYIGKIIALYPVSIIFFTFSILVVMNGMNLIDGMNGLFALTAFFQLITLAILSYLYEDYESLFTNGGESFGRGTSVNEIKSRGIPLNKIVVGKYICQKYQQFKKTS